MSANNQSLQWPNPLGTDGFEFVEYTAPNAAELGRLFESMGFSRAAAGSVPEQKLRNHNLSLDRDPGGTGTVPPALCHVRPRTRSRSGISIAAPCAPPVLWISISRYLCKPLRCAPRDCHRRGLRPLISGMPIGPSIRWSRTIRSMAATCEREIFLAAARCLAPHPPRPAHCWN